MTSCRCYCRRRIVVSLLSFFVLAGTLPNNHLGRLPRSIMLQRVSWCVAVWLCLYRCQCWCQLLSEWMNVLALGVGILCACSLENFSQLFGGWVLLVFGWYSCCCLSFSTLYCSWGFFGEQFHDFTHRFSHLLEYCLQPVNRINSCCCCCRLCGVAGDFGLSLSWVAASLMTWT